MATTLESTTNTLTTISLDISSDITPSDTQLTTPDTPAAASTTTSAEPLTAYSYSSSSLQALPTTSNSPYDFPPAAHTDYRIETTTSLYLDTATRVSTLTPLITPIGPSQISTLKSHLLASTTTVFLSDTAISNPSILSPNRKSNSSQVKANGPSNYSSTASATSTNSGSLVPSNSVSSQSAGVTTVQKIVFGILGAVIAVACLATLFGWLYKRMVMHRSTCEELSIDSFDNSSSRFCGLLNISRKGQAAEPPCLPSFGQSGAPSTKPAFFAPSMRDKRRSSTDASYPSTTPSMGVLSRPFLYTSVNNHDDALIDAFRDDLSTRRPSSLFPSNEHVTPFPSMQQSMRSRTPFSYLHCSQNIPSDRISHGIPLSNQVSLPHNAPLALPVASQLSENLSSASGGPSGSFEINQHGFSSTKFSVKTDNKRSSRSSVVIRPLTEYSIINHSKEDDHDGILAHPPDDLSWASSIRRRLSNVLTSFGPDLKENSSSILPDKLPPLYPHNAVIMGQTDVPNESAGTTKEDVKDFGIGVGSTMSLIQVMRKGRVRYSTIPPTPKSGLGN